MLDWGRAAVGRGLEVVVAGAGGAAHLPGMLAAVTPLPVVGVPVPLAHLDGMDSLLSIVQMPAGVPVATVSIGGARNAGLLAARILGVADLALRERMTAFPGRPQGVGAGEGCGRARRQWASGVPASDVRGPRRTPSGDRPPGRSRRPHAAWPCSGWSPPTCWRGAPRTAAWRSRSGWPADGPPRCSRVLLGVSLALVTGGRERHRGVALGSRRGRAGDPGRPGGPRSVSRSVTSRPGSR